MSEETDLATVVELLDDEYARAILAATSIEPMSAAQLAERCEASPPTVCYRRLDRLREEGPSRPPSNWTRRATTTTRCSVPSSRAWRSNWTTGTTK